MNSKQKKYQKSLVWLRRDLRLSDHSALSHASQMSKSVALCFVFDTRILNFLKNKADTRIQFIFDSLEEINLKLQKKGSNLIYLFGDPTEEIPKLVRTLKFDSVFTNEDYTPYARHRDHQVEKSLDELTVDFHSFKDHVIFSSKEVLKPNQTPYQVFTPYKKSWLQKLKPEDYQPLVARSQFLSSTEIPKKFQTMSLKKIGFQETPLSLKGGEIEAKKLLKMFDASIGNYKKARDFPASESGTSTLSPHLRFGTISIRECVHASLKKRDEGSETWLSELIWREFYQMIIAEFPHVVKKSFKPEYDKIKWPGTKKHLDAWKQGKTGYPIVDAGMRQLNQTGWMHNRVRMITASFLIKDLLVDWKKGEAYFAEKLLDFDLASNNGGWQWVASTGCDAAPYFRIFHPVTQSKKFDSNGDYIRKWVPELKTLSKDAIHFPSEAKPGKLPSGFHLGKNYPHPIVDHSVQRKLTLELYGTR